MDNNVTLYIRIQKSVTHKFNYIYILHYIDYIFYVDTKTNDTFKNHFHSMPVLN